MALTHYQRYVSWNNRIALYWLARPVEGEHVYLTVTPAALASAAWECDGVAFAPDEAEQDFLDAAREMYRAHIIERGHDIQSIDVEHEGMLLSLGLLALSVLAAYHMRADDERRSTAYFPRLAELLDAGDDEPPNFS